MNKNFSILAAPILCIMLLIGIVSEGQTRVKKETTNAYHDAAKAAIAALPLDIGAWKGRDKPLDQGADRLLNYPDVMYREYRDTANPQMERKVGVLVIHCRDTRDLNGHYPPVCYPAQGEELKYQADHDFVINGLKIPTREYHFHKLEPQAIRRTCVYNFLIAPGKGIVRDMKAVSAAAEDYQQRYYGASQVWVQMFADLPEDQRNEIFRTLVGALTDCIRTLESGGLKK